jgi:YD repeat-containing protein
LLERNGTIRTFYSGYEVKVKDRNGNVLCLTADCATLQDNGTAGWTQTITDDFGRTTSITYGASSGGASTTTISYPGTGGVSRTITVNYALLGSVLRSGFALETDATLFGGICGVSTQTGCTSLNNPTVASGVVLADLTTYKFLYDSYGNLSEVDLPTGGSYQYDYNPPTVTAQGSGVSERLPSTCSSRKSESTRALHRAARCSK